MARRVRREEVIRAIVGQGYAYVWEGYVETYESVPSARYVTACVVDKVPVVEKYDTIRDEKYGHHTEYVAKKVILSPLPFKVLVSVLAFEDREYKKEKVEVSRRVEGEELKKLLDIIK